MSDLDLMRKRFVSILRSPPCQKVDFWLGGLHVAGAGFTMIAHALEKAGVDGKGITLCIDDPGEGAAAAYQGSTNTMIVPRLDWAATDTFERLAVVHEAVHALRDSEGKVLTYEGRPYRPRAATDEAAAYVAGCLFNVFEQREGGRAAATSPDWLKARKAPIHAIAYAVALRQADRKPGSPVERQELATMFHSISQHRRKKGTPMPRYFEYDGLPM